MVDFTVPYAMNNTEVPAEALRRQQQDVVGEGSGVVRAADLKIVPLDVPGQGVKIMPGHDLIQSRAPGRDRETYGVQLNTAANYLGDDGQGIPGTGSSGGRRDMIIHEILNPEEDRHFTAPENWPEGATSKLSVVQNVPASAVTVDQVPALNEVTCYGVAAINWPVSTGTITAAMLEDLRKIHAPKTEEQIITYSLVAGNEEVLTATGANGEVWPNAFTNSAERAVIPDWATQVDISVMWNGVECLSAAATTAVWCQIAGNTGNPAAGAHIVTQRTTLRGSSMFAVADRRSVPAALRGKSHRIYGMARLVGAVSGADRPKLDGQSSMQIRLVWRQVAE